MQEVTCFHCRNNVRITPDADLCTECGEDLRHLLAPDYIAQYFHELAGNLMAQGNPHAAFVEVERGIAYRESIDLHLLAAILAEQTGQYHEMRRHVAAIPVDDTLRPEAEWLLRSHQDRQRALREGRSGKRSVERAAAASILPASGILADLFSGAGPSQISNNPKFVERMLTIPVTLGLVTMLLVGGVWFGQGNGIMAQWLRGVVASPAGGVGNGIEVAAAVDTELTADGPAHASETEASATDELAAGQDVLIASDTVENADVVLPAGQLPTATIVTKPESETVAGLHAPLAALDIPDYLREQGLSDLADLPIDVQVTDGVVILEGIVAMDVQRRRLVEALSAIPGVTAINTEGIVLQPLPTYEVQEGDTLWYIVYDIYGDGDAERVAAFHAANLDILPSPDALAVGMVLKVPPVVSE